MNLKKYICIVPILLFMLAGCEKTEPIVWENHIGVLQEGSAGCDYNETNYNGVTYQVQADIWTEKEKEAYVENVTKFLDELDYLSDNRNDKNFTVCIADSILTKVGQEELYFNSEDCNTLEGYVKVFQMYHEDEIEYGLAYGITANLCEKLNLCDVETSYSDEDLEKFFSDEEQFYLLDFTLPMFETYYFNQETVKYVQAASLSYTNFVIEQKALQAAYQLCLTPQEETVVEWKNEWLKSIGVETNYTPFAVLSFEWNNEKMPDEYPYVLKDVEANWYFHPDDVNVYGYKMFISEYLIVEELMELDFAEVREFFAGYLTEDVPPVDICTMFSNEGIFTGLYRINENHIELYYDWEQVKYVLVHEYVHYLTSGVMDMLSSTGTFAEGIAEEVATWGCTNHLRNLYMSNFYDEEQMKTLHCWDENEERISDEGLIYASAHCYYAGYLIGKTYTTVEYKMTERDKVVRQVGCLSYEEMTSLTHYLIEQYGRDTVYKAYCSFDCFQELVGMDFQLLYEDWGEWNKEQCDNMGLQFEDK